MRRRAAGLVGPPAPASGFDYLLPMTKVRPVSVEASYFASPAAGGARRLPAEML
jgi:hypothetical protein